MAENAISTMLGRRFAGRRGYGRSTRRPGVVCGSWLLAFCLLSVVRVDRVHAVEGWEAGVARADITPAEPVRLAHGPLVGTPAESTNDPLHCRVLALRDGGGVLTVLVSVDGHAVSEGLREAVCGDVRGRLGIYRVRIAFTATGVGSAPLVREGEAGELPLSPQDAAALDRYSALLRRGVVEAIRAACSSFVPVTLHATRSGERPLLLARGDGGDVVAAVWFHALPAGGDAAPEAYRVSAGFPGRVSHQLEERWHGAVVLPFAGPARLAARAAAAAPREDANAVAAALIELAAQAGAIAGAIDAQIEYVVLPYAAPAGQGVAERKVPVQVMRFTDRPVWLFVPGELPPSSAERLAALAGGTWIVSKANAAHGLLLPAGEEALLGVAAALVEPSADESRRARWKPPPGLAPAEALASFRLRPGFRIELAAAEPEVTDPVAIAFDEDGRLLVCEMRDYPLGPGEGKPADGRVRVLEDRDADGRYETSFVLAAELPYPTGIACWRGGVFVAATSDVVYLRDADGDGRADVRETILSGFQPGNSQHLLNSFAFGPDSRFWVNGGDGADVRNHRVPDAPVLALRLASFRFDPRTYLLEATTGYRGGFGVTFDQGGERFVCDNTNHAQHVVFSSADLARNPALGSAEAIAFIPAYEGVVYPASAPLERFNDPWHKGHFSSACGVHVYLGHQFPEEFRGSFFVCEPVSNLVHRATLEPVGGTFTAHRGEEGAEFLASTDHWFRPVNCATGPDGALYIADMYREVIEHPEWIPEHVQKQFDLRSGIDRGRIWRVVHASNEADEKPLVRLPRDAAALGPWLEHPNGWVRETAQRLLVETGGEQAISAARRVLGEDPAAGGVQALGVLRGLDALVSRDLEVAFASSRAATRCRALRLLGDEGVPPSAGDAERARLIERVVALAADGDRRVRFAVACALGVFASDERKTRALAALARRDGDDVWLRRAVLAASGEEPLALLASILSGFTGAPGEESFLSEVSALLARRGRADELDAALKMLLDGSADSFGARLRAFGALTRPLAAGVLAAATRRSTSEGGAGPFSRFLARVAARAADETFSLAEREDAVELLGLQPSPAALDSLAGFLDSRYAAEIQVAAVRGLGRALLHGADAAGIVRRFLAAFARQTPRVRGEVLDALIGHEAARAALLVALEEDRLPPQAIDPARRQLLAEATSGDETERFRAVFNRVAADADRGPVVERYTRILAGETGAGAASSDRGRELFRRHCASCHRRAGEGFAVGPDLESVRDRALDALVVDILDPSRAVDPRFSPYIIVTKDGKVLNGVLLGETATHLVLRLQEGKTETVSRADVVEFRAGEKSLMPDGMESELPPEALRDLIAYLKESPAD